MKNTDFNDQLGISHRLVSAAASTCARKELFLSSLSVPVICLFHQKCRVLIISCVRTPRCLLIISGGGGVHGRTQSSIIEIYSSHFRRTVPNFSHSGIILHLVMSDNVLRFPSGVVSEWRRAAGGADKPDRGRSGPVRAADWLAARHPLHRDGSCRHWPRRGRSEPPHQTSE